ncbi:VPLPA-CTERM sorting domain-containing protein [Sulfurirhabdus autotrophica]|uniref:Putative secreted protein n=1 Tax=Sulfurirhabdus autotrophica TaxID=1706046 RepID=A0A4R3XTF0_9PROT|nr:VPLPA-CTERM sorting domain-containing protein [Sulfurirhabdus autotrophica]TCV78081.1 putative secreted protein [Sulfurirhabdus autotrophica]
MRFNLRMLILLVSLLTGILSNSFSQASVVNITSDTSSISASADACDMYNNSTCSYSSTVNNVSGSNPFIASLDYAPSSGGFNAYAHADINSTISLSTNLLTGSGNTHAHVYMPSNGGYSSAYASSAVILNFSLTSQSNFSLLLNGNTYDPMMGTYNYGSNIFNLSSVSTVGACNGWAMAFSQINSNINKSGLIPACDFKLTVSASAGPTWPTNSGGASYSYSLQFTPVAAPVPLPAAFWLFVSGLLGLMSVGRKYKSA